ncbi:MAG: TPM domain-containing protein [Clostridia bacterium]|nr:TPM domain-containing protein [Clostridia bacterium]
MRSGHFLKLCLTIMAIMALCCAPASAKVVSPGEDYYYLDNAGVLSEALEGEIFFSNKLLYDACGAQIVVITVDSTGREAIDDYAYQLFYEWGIGDASKDNGFLLLLAIDDDDYYARTGSGLDSRFSAATIKEYYDRYLESDFAAKNYEKGVKKFFEAVFEHIATLYNASVSPADGVAAYEEYVAQSDAAAGYGGYKGSRRNGAQNQDYRSYQQDDDSGFGAGLVFIVLLIIVLVIVMSKGRRARRRARIVPPPPPTPVIFGYRPTRTVYHGPVFRGPPTRSSGFASSGRSRSGGRSSSGGLFGGLGSSGSSFGGGGASRSFSGGRSSGFGGASGGGGRSSGGGAGRGRH